MLSLRCFSGFDGFSFHRAWRIALKGSISVVLGLSCLATCGILPVHGLNPYPLHWKTILNLWTTRKVQCSYFWFDFLTTIKLRAASMKDNWSGRYIKYFILLISSVSQFRSSVMSNSLWPHESQHARPPCPSPTPRVYSNSCPSSWWCHPAISSSVVPVSSCSQSLPASRSFPTSQLFAWGGQNIELSASASVLPMNTQDLFPSGWTGQLSL